MKIIYNFFGNYGNAWRMIAPAICITAVFLGGQTAARAQAPATTPPPAPAAPAATSTNAPAATPPTLPDSTGTANNQGTAVDLTWPAPADPKKVTMDEVIQNVAHNKVAINVVWTLVTGFLVMFMQAGFALVEAGLCRAKNAAHVFSMNFMIYGLGMLGFWICGFAIMFGGVGVGPGCFGFEPSLGQGINLLNKEFYIMPNWGLFGYTGFFLDPSVFDTAIFCLFLFEMVFMDTTATIPTGAMAERWDFRNFFIYGFWVGMIPYAVFGNWVWGGGWLAELGQNLGLGHGHVDFAGSSVVHMTGGVIGLVGAWVIGPRLGKFDKSGKPRAIPAHDIPMVFLGTFILAFGWFGFNPGSTLAGTDMRIAIIAVNTMLASAAGAVAAAIIMWIWFGKPDPSMLCNGMLAGLVAITAPCAFVNSMGAVLIGIISGILVVLSVFFVERVLKIDDPVGAVSVHGTNGAWGVISVGLFANGTYGQGWGGVHVLLKGATKLIINNDGSAEALKKFTDAVSGGYVDQGVTGAFGTLFGAGYNDWSQLGAQCTGTLTNFVAVGLMALIWFKLSNYIFPIRSKKEDELAGLDLPEMGALAYPDFQLTDATSPRVD